MKKSGKKSGARTDDAISRPMVACGSGKKADKGTVAGRSAKTGVSSRGRDLTGVKKLLGSVPEVRSELVVRFKAEVESGKYYVDAGRVAEKMIEKALKNATKRKKI